jgi:hypothetical protein
MIEWQMYTPRLALEAAWFRIQSPKKMSRVRTRFNEQIKKDDTLNVSTVDVRNDIARRKKHSTTILCATTTGKVFIAGIE